MVINFLSWRKGKLGVVGTLLLTSFLLVTMGGFPALLISGQSNLIQANNPRGADAYTPSPGAVFYSVDSINASIYGTTTDFSSMQTQDSLYATLSEGVYNGSQLRFEQIYQFLGMSQAPYLVKMLCVDMASVPSADLWVSVGPDAECIYWLGHITSSGENWFDVTSYVAGTEVFVAIGDIYDSGDGPFLVDYLGLCWDHLNADPTSTNCPDANYPAGEPGHSVSWVITDTEGIHNGQWQIRVGATTVASGAFTTSGQEVSTACSQEPGIYTYTVYVDDGYSGFLALDSAIVTVTNAAPTASDCPNASYWDYESGHIVSWVITDTAGIHDGQWQIRLNGNVVASGPFTTSGQSVNTSCSQVPGIYNYVLYVNDGYTGLLALDPATVTVTDDDTSGPSLQYLTYWYSGGYTFAIFFIYDSQSGLDTTDMKVLWYSGSWTPLVVYIEAYHWYVGAIAGYTAPFAAYAYDNDKDWGSSDRASTLIFV